MHHKKNCRKILVLNSLESYTNRNVGIWVLILVFSFSSVDAAKASQIVEVSPIIVQPEDLSQISQQMLAQDRVNQDQESAIKGLIEDNQRLTDTALARKQDASLDKISQTMANYRDYLIARERARMAANDPKNSKYYDLIKLTEKVDDMKSAGQTLQLKSNVIEDKYKILTELRDEMMALNKKLSGQGAPEHFARIMPAQGDNIQVLTRKLGEMDQRIDRYDAILAQKNQQIAQLKETVNVQRDQLDTLQSMPHGLSSNESVRWLNLVLTVTRYKAEYYQLTSQQNRLAMQQVQGQVKDIKEDFSGRFKNYNQFESDILSLKDQVNQLGMQLSKKQDQVELLKSELERRITAPVRSDDRLKLAQKLLGLQQQETALLEEKNGLQTVQNAAIEKNQGLLAEQIQQLKGRLQDKEDQMAAMEAKIETGEQARENVDSLKQQLASEQDKADQLKQNLDSKTMESDKLTGIVGDYQKKLEAKDNAYNEQLGQSLSSKNYQVKLEMENADLNTRLQEKEAQVVKIKKELYDLQGSTGINNKEVTDLKTKLELARQELAGMPSRDEINALRTGLKQEGLQLKQKDAMLLQTRADADEYSKEFKAQSMEFKSLKEQLQGAYDEIHRNNNELKDKDMEIVQLKEHSTVSEGDLRDQLKALTQKLGVADKKLKGRAQEKENAQMLLEAKADADEYARKYREQSLQFESLKKQLQNAYDQISRKNEDLKYKNMEIIRLKERSHLSKTDIAGDKLKQALDKIDQQGRLINTLVQKLQDAGQTVDLSRQ